MQLDEFADILLRRAHRTRCLVQGCYYGLRSPADACIYCGDPKPCPPMGVSPIAGLMAKVGQVVNRPITK